MRLAVSRRRLNSAGNHNLQIVIYSLHGSLHIDTAPIASAPISFAQDHNLQIVIPCLPRPSDAPLDRPTADLHHGLWLQGRLLPEARAEPAGQNQCLRSRLRFPAPRSFKATPPGARKRSGVPSHRCSDRGTTKRLVENERIEDTPRDTT